LALEEVREEIMIEVVGNGMRHPGAFGVLALCSLFAIAAAPPARADTTYTYTGNPFTDFSGTDACTAGVGECCISVSFTVGSPLPDNLAYPFFLTTPLSFSITDGVNTLTELNALPFLGNPLIYVGTGPGGQIGNWYVQEDGTIGQDQFILGTFGPECSIGCDSTDNLSPTSYGFAASSDEPGSWTITTTPEPSSLMLLGIGLLGMAGAWRWRKLGQNH
jgi:hypothetical protein